MKKIFSYYLPSISIVLSVIAISCSISKLSIDNTTIVLTFIGILATFIVVSNYAQVHTITSDLEKKIENIEDQQKQLTAIVVNILDQVEKTVGKEDKKEDHDG